MPTARCPICRSRKLTVVEKGPPGFPGMPFCTDCRVAIKWNGETSPLYWDDIKQCYCVKFVGVTQWFSPPLSVIDTITGPLHMEPKISKKASKEVGDRVGGFTGRTRCQELAVIKALLDTLENLEEECYHEILLETLERHPWISTYFRATYDLNRKYGLKPKHLKMLLNPSRQSIPMGLFTILTALQCKTISPVEGAMQWWAMLQELDPALRKVANMILKRQLGPLTRQHCNIAMRQLNLKPYIRKLVDEQEA